MGNYYYKQGNYTKSLENHFEALKIKESLEDEKGIMASYNNIGSVYLLQNNYPDALENHLAALKIREEIGDKYGLASSYNKLGSLFLKLKNYSETKKYLTNGLALAQEIGAMEYIEESYRGMAVLDSATGNWKDAYLHHKLFTLYRDSLVNEENTKKTVQTQMQYEFDKKETATKAEQDKKDIRQRNIRNSIGGGLAGALLFLVVVYRQRNKISKEKKRSDELLLNILPEEAFGFS